MDVTESDTVESTNSNSERVHSNRCYVGNLSYQTRWQTLKDYMRQAGEVVFAEVLMGYDGRSKGCGIVEYGSAADAQNAIRTLSDTRLDGRLIFVREDREANKRQQKGNTPQQTYTKQQYTPHVNSNNLSPTPPTQIPTQVHTQPQLHAQPKPHTPAPQPVHQQQLLVNHTHTTEEVADESTESQQQRAHRSDVGRKIFINNLPYSTTWQDLKDTFNRVGKVIRADVLQNAQGQSKGAGIVLFEQQEDAQRAIKEFNETWFAGRQIFVREDKFAY